MLVNIALAAINMTLYSSLCIISFYYYLLLRKKKEHLQTQQSATNEQALEGKYDDLKKIFFVAMAISGALDVPLYIGCIVEGGPQACRWDSLAYSATYSLHILALSGYEICLGIPLYIWSDMMTGHSEFKRVFMVMTALLYFLLQVLTVILIFINYDPSYTFASNTINAGTVCAEAIFIFCLAVAWLWVGVKIQLYVRDIGAKLEAETKFLFKVNVVMITIVVCFFFRAYLVLRLAVNPASIPYPMWLFLTRWLPYVLCSYLLIFLMRQKTRRSDVNENIASTVRSSMFGQYYKEGSQEGSVEDSDETQVRTSYAAMLFGVKPNMVGEHAFEGSRRSSASSLSISERSDWSDQESRFSHCSPTDDMSGSSPTKASSSLNSRERAVPELFDPLL